LQAAFEHTLPKHLRHLRAIARFAFLATL